MEMKQSRIFVRLRTLCRAFLVVKKSHLERRSFHALPFLRERERGGEIEIEKEREIKRERERKRGRDRQRERYVGTRFIHRSTLGNLRQSVLRSKITPPLNLSHYATSPHG